MIGALTTLKLCLTIVTLNVIRRAQPKQIRHCLFFHSEDAKIDHFKPPWSSNVTKINGTCTFYIEWQSKSLSLSWCISLLYEYSSCFHSISREASTQFKIWYFLFSFCILAFKGPIFRETRTRTIEQCLFTSSVSNLHVCVIMRLENRVGFFFLASGSVSPPHQEVLFVAPLPEHHSYMPHWFGAWGQWVCWKIVIPKSVTCAIDVRITSLSAWFSREHNEIIISSLNGQDGML